MIVSYGSEDSVFGVGSGYGGLNREMKMLMLMNENEVVKLISR